MFQVENKIGQLAKLIRDWLLLPGTRFFPFLFSTYAPSDYLALNDKQKTTH